MKGRVDESSSKSRRSGSGYRGVCLTAGRYRGRLLCDGVTLDVGRWPTARDAAVALDRAILCLGYDIPLQVARTSKRLGPRHPRLLRADARDANRHASSKYLGVTKMKGGWEASCSHNHATYRVHKFKTAREAALVHDRMALFYKGPGCERNFPTARVVPASRQELCDELEPKRPPRDSRYHGVHLAKHVKDRVWQAMAYGRDRRSHFCGMWETERKAAIAHDRAVLHLFGGNPPFRNFPKQKLEPASPAQMKREAVTERKATNTSRYLGVYFQKGAWVAAITTKDGIQQYIGRFEDEEEAARVRDREARKYSGPRTKYNFPRKGER